ncbi:hypothetical protein DdX_15108 [Ditylenchus destructor]|uniref:DUF6314 domain-containing protein n=1 Tax=Ditylenchus destructor TaxID=166010 RepID=A0AAD4R189_9BILA|nr:hypothetical protein DdX_15108 [Ditylenchus destructor]
MLNRLRGKWNVQRTLNDHVRKERANVTGTATWTPNNMETDAESPTQLLYLEDVLLRWENGNEHRATKKYKYCLGDRDTSAVAKFNVIPDYGGGPEKEEKMFDLHFSEVDGKVKANGEFLCGKDLYKAMYEWKSPEEFRLDYTSKGPDKNFLTCTIYRKIP